MKAPSDELYEAVKGRYAERDYARRALRTAEALLFQVVLEAMPKAIGRKLPADVKRMLEDAAAAKPGALLERFRPKLVELCMSWNGR